MRGEEGGRKTRGEDRREEGSGEEIKRRKTKKQQEVGRIQVNESREDEEERGRGAERRG